VTGRRAARIAAVLLVASATGFVIGVSLESGDEHTESSGSTERRDEGANASEGDAHDEEGEPGEHDEAAEESHDDDSGEERTVLGLDPEAPALVAVAALASLALAVGLWRTPRRPVALAAVVFAVVFTVFDVAEVTHQLDEDRTGLALLAAAIALGHAGAALAAGRAALGRA